MNLIATILKVIAERKDGRTTNRHIVSTIIELPEMAYLRSDYKELGWDDSKITAHVIRDYAKTVNEALQRMKKNGQIKTVPIKKSEMNIDLFGQKMFYKLTKVGIKEIDKTKKQSV